MKKSNRRSFLQKSWTGLLSAPFILSACQSETDNNTLTNQEDIQSRYAQLDKVASKPVLKKELFSDPVIIESLELLRYQDNFICRVQSKEGVVGEVISNNMQMISLYPIFTNRLQPFFIGKDARNVEALLEEVYVYKSNYKLQNLALWVPLATIEFALLDLLGKTINQPVGKLIGDIHHPTISVYQANNYRGKTAEESIEKIIENVEASQAKAVKFKVGGRMSKNKDYPAGRTEQLIPLVRKTFGESLEIYADSNGSYDAQEAIRIGKILEDYKIDFYEEPTPFDWYEETKQVTDALKVPIAGGEQEPSMRNFRWLIANNALDIVQPDIFYFGGMIRAMRVARIADASNKMCTPHISGSGLGYLYMCHFVSAVPNAGPFHEFKGVKKDIPVHCESSSLQSEKGIVTVPTGAGMGVEIDPDFVKKHKLIS